MVTTAHAHPCFSCVFLVASSVATRLSHHFGRFPPVVFFFNFGFASTVHQIKSEHSFLCVEITGLWCHLVTYSLFELAIG